MRIVAIEEHFLTEEYLSYLRSRKEYPRLETIDDKGHGRIERLWHSPHHFFMHRSDSTMNLDMVEERLREMDKAGINMQVLSLAGPGVESFSASDGTAIARKTNDELARVIKKYPQRLAGFAALAPQDPGGAAEELGRTVKELGFRGAKINSHVGGEYLDDRKYWIIFEKAERLGVPIYLHPREPSPDMLKPYSAYPGLAGAMWGFAAEAGLHAMRLICGGVFDEFPRLKIILGHLGEGLPFFLWRIDNQWSKTPLARERKRKPSEYFKENFFVTTSGMSWQPALVFACSVLGADKILFAVDYPYESNEDAVRCVETAPVGSSDKDKIYHVNADKLLGLE